LFGILIACGMSHYNDRQRPRLAAVLILNVLKASNGSRLKFLMLKIITKNQ